MGSRLRVVGTCATHAGAQDENEESSVVLVGDSAPAGTLGLVAVADGIGGRGTGAMASSIAIKTLADVFAGGCAALGMTLSDIPHLLRFAVQKANAAVFHAQEVDEALKGMGTTCLAAAITSDHVHIVSIGDSRAYLFRRGRLRLLTEDEWQKRADGITVVNRAIGWQPTLPLEPSTFEFKPGDRLLLCTDGLTDVVPEDAIREILAMGAGDDACTLLIERAAATGSDDITVVVVKLGQEQEPNRSA